MGTHTLFFARVVVADTADRDPLVYHTGSFNRLAKGCASAWSGGLPLPLPQKRRLFFDVDIFCLFPEQQRDQGQPCHRGQIDADPERAPASCAPKGNRDERGHGRS